MPKLYPAAAMMFFVPSYPPPKLIPKAVLLKNSLSLTEMSPDDTLAEV
jgi:hypothetical protein